ncbi:gliding motility protein GldG [Methylophaga frappieri]|uniref:Gliding motility protein GldG n=2 Tax=Methylophaga frappieri (strain ATCC BAA-2434 / DSM 25690 / JAM7) TaxID=754477 RepID=I1YI62_METFJ|nr:gliding motility protein GldG [Methylophaga frappieri]
MNKSVLSKTGLALAVVLFVSFIIVVNENLRSFRVDLTEDKLYTLSEGTQNILSGLQEPITLRLYYAERVAQALPAVKSYGQRVQELLREYQRASGGMIRLKIIDPVPYSNDEHRADQYGLQSIPIEGEEDPLYFGLAGTNLLNGLEIIRFFQPEKEDTLEYDLTRLIFQLSDVQRKNIGVLSSLSLDGEQYDPLKGEVISDAGSKPWPVMDQLRMMFDVSMLPDDIRRIPTSLDVLMVIHPKSLTDSTLYAIDQYVLSGGKLITFVDPFAEVDVPEKDPENPMAALTAQRGSNMPELFNAWGFERDGQFVVADRKFARKVDFGARTGNEPIDYVLWLGLNDGSLNMSEKITSRLKRINVATSGFFKQLDGATTQMTPLVSSSDEAMLVDKRVVQFRNDPVGLLTRYEAGTKQYPLAVRVTGDVKTAFPDGAKNNMGDLQKMPDHLDMANEPIDIIAVADVDMIDDQFWVQVQDFYGQDLAFNTSNNLDFVYNAIEDLTGTDGLISVRSRAGFSRPFILVNEIEREAERRYRATERELEQRLQDTEQKIARMQVQRSGTGEQILTAEQQKEINEARLLAERTEAELRTVKGNLRQDLDALEAVVKFVNIGVVPILVGILALITGWLRLRKRTHGRFNVNKTGS